MKQLLIVTLSCLLACSVLAQDGDSLVTEFEYDQDGLHFLSTLIGDEGFFEEWQKPEPPILTTVSRYWRGDKVFPIIVLGTEVTGENGYPNLTYDIRISRPDGTDYGHYEDLTLWKDAPADQLHLIQQPIVIRLEETDPFGVYAIDITVHDNIREVDVSYRLTFEVIEEIKLSADQMDYQLSHFYEDPNANMLPALMRAVDSAGFLENKNARPPMIGFFTTAMSAAASDSLAFKNTIDDLGPGQSILAQCYMLSRYTDTILNWKTADASDNDRLWGAFFASGDRRYVERLVDHMKYCDETKSIYVFMTGSSARWSLCSNARQHPLVRAYLEDMLADAPEDTKARIREALTSDPATLYNRMLEEAQKFKSQ